MKPKNISFAEVLKTKTRSPQLPPKQTSPSLTQLFEQWQQQPEEDYTLYLGSFKNSHKSRHSSTRMFASRNPSENEQMFDSWIQRQSVVNANKENIITQPRKTLQPQETYKKTPSSKFAFSSKGQARGPQIPRTAKQSNVNRPPAVNKAKAPMVHIGGNIQMIKSNTLQRQEIEERRSPKHRDQGISIEMEEVSSNYRQPYQEEMKAHEERQEQKGYQESYQEEKMVASNKIRELVDYTQNHLNEDIAERAQQIVAQERLQNTQEHWAEKQSSQKESESEAEEEDEIDLNMNPLGGGEEVAFNEDYAEKARKEEQVQRKRREEAKMILNGLMKNRGNKERVSNTFTNFQMEPEEKTEPTKLVEGHSGVGYSFASSAMDSAKNNSQSLINQLKTQSILENKAELPIPENKMEESYDSDFRKKYVKEESNTENNQIQSIQSVQYDTHRSIRQDSEAKNLPNSSFEPKLIQNEQSMKNSQDRQPASPPSETKENAKIDVTHVTHGIKVSLNPTTSFENEQAPTQKAKKTSSQKLKVYSNSGKGSNSSQEKQVQSQMVAQVKTMPFVEHPDRPEPCKLEQKEMKGSPSSPFLTIKEVKESIVSPAQMASPENSYHTGTATVSEYYETSKNEGPSYALPSQTATYKQSYTVSNYNNSSSPSQNENKSILPSYATSKMATPEAFQTTQTYQKTVTEKTVTFHQNLPYDSKKEGRRSYLADLELKQSINVEEPKKLEFRKHDFESKKITVGNSKEGRGLLDKEIKSSLKQSINLKASSEFTFDF